MTFVVQKRLAKHFKMSCLTSKLYVILYILRSLIGSCNWFFDHQDIWTRFSPTCEKDWPPLAWICPLKTKCPLNKWLDKVSVSRKSFCEFELVCEGCTSFETLCSKFRSQETIDHQVASWIDHLKKKENQDRLRPVSGLLPEVGFINCCAPNAKLLRH